MTHRVNLAGQMPLISLIVLCAVTALLTDRFLSPLNLANILVQSSIMAVIAIGMTFVIVGGGFDLSVGSIAALAGCIAAMVMREAGIGAGDSARRALLRDACHALRPARLCHRRRPRGGVSLGCAGSPCDMLHLCVVWRARRCRRSDAGGAAAIRPADCRRVLRIDRHRR